MIAAPDFPNGKRGGGKSELHRAGCSVTRSPGDGRKVPQKTNRPEGRLRSPLGVRVKR
jgi:hypothetical protein